MPSRCITGDHGSRVYANEAEARWRNRSSKNAVELEIRQIPARVRHLRTNGKLERLHGGMQRKIPEFGAMLMRTGDPVVRFMKWYDY